MPALCCILTCESTDRISIERGLLFYYSMVWVFGDTSKSDDNSSSRAFFICITFKLIPDVYGERDVGGK